MPSCSSVSMRATTVIDALPSRRALLDRHAPVDAVFLGRIVACRLVIGAAVVPDDDVTLAPCVAVATVGLDHVAGQLLDQRVALLVVEALDSQDLAGIEVERLAPGLGMGADDRADDRMEDRRPVAVLLVEQCRRLSSAAVGEDPDPTVESLLEPLRERLVR